MKKTVIASFITIVLSAALANPADAQNSKEEMPPEWQNVINALEALNHHANPGDWKAYSVTAIWTVQIHGLPVDTANVNWEEAWHALIAWETGSTIEDLNNDRAGQYCEKARVKKAEYGEIARAVGGAAAFFASASEFLPGARTGVQTPYVRTVSWQLKVTAAVLGVWSFQIGGIANSIQQCA